LEHRKRRWYSPRSIVDSIAIRPRLYHPPLSGIGELVFLARSRPASLREALSSDLSAAIYLALAFWVMLTCKGEIIRARAKADRDSSDYVARDHVNMCSY
jgi:hypothetical protein